VAVPPTPAPTTVVAAAGVETPPIPAAPVVPPAAAKRPIAPSEPTDKPAFKAGIWVIVVVTIILLAVAGLLGHAVMVKLSNAKQATVTAPDKPAKPAVPAVSADQTVKPGRIVVDSPTSAPGKMIAKALDTVDAHNQSGLAQGVNEVLDNAPSGSAAAKPGIPTAASKVTVATNPAQPTETVASDSVVEAPAGLVAKVPEPPPEPSASFRTLVVNMKVSGVFQGNPGRALLNGRMLHTGESVDSRLNVILFDINSEKKLLVFKDTRTGATMSRHY
jgi:hypothetical protein